MKILIIASPRSGSTTLVNALGKVLKLKVYREPFLEEYIGDPYIDSEPHIIKTMVKYLYRSNLNFSDFDHILYLSRKNIREAAISFDYQLSHFKGKPLLWHTPYYLEDAEPSNESLNLMKDSYKKIKKMADFYVDYDELYGTDKHKVYEIIKKWGFEDKADEIYKEIKSVHKYRRTTKHEI